MVFSSIFGDLDVGSVNCTQEESAVKSKLHVTLRFMLVSTSISSGLGLIALSTIGTYSSRSLGTGSTDLYTNVRGRDEDFGDRDTGLPVSYTATQLHSTRRRDLTYSPG